MSDYPTRDCGECPHLGAFQRVENETGRPYTSYLGKNTTPKPHVTFKDSPNLDQPHLGVVTSKLKPNLAVGPVFHEKSAEEKKINLMQNEKNEEQNLGYKGGIPPCISLERNRRDFSKAPSLVKPKNVYVENDSCEKGDKIECDCQQTQVPKPVLKYQPVDAMHAAAGRYPPNETDPSSLVPVPNSLRPIPAEQSKEPCYLPQPQDIMPHPGDLSMGPVGPWATGRMDWGPLSGLTGTRPVVDKYSISRYSEGDWRHHNKEVIDESNTEQHRANLIDWNSRQCLEQTQSDTDKNQADSTKRLNQRELEVHRWKCELERAIAAESEEIGFMEEQRRRLKQAGAVLTIPESISGECLGLRGSRIDGELVRDEVEEEVIKEVALCSEIRDIFFRTLNDVEKQLLENKTAKQRLEFDWSDKKTAHEIDSISMALNNRSTVLMFKPGAVCFPDEQSTPEYWEHFTKENLLEGEATRQRSVTLRGTIDVILNNAARDLRSQADRVELSLSRRIACVQETTNRLEDELKQVLRKLADMENLIDELRSAIRRMDTPMKKAQTRLDNRLQRPRVENCRDAPHFGLVEEVKSIGESIASLQAQLKQAQISQDNLIKARGNLEKEIMVKRKTLEVDNFRIKRIRSFYPSAAALSGYV